MITIKFEFANIEAVNATLIAALGEAPAKISYQLIQQTHLQVAEQTKAPEPAPPPPQI
jgi:hypothetical protein